MKRVMRKRLKEDELVRRAVGGDAEAFGDLYMRYLDDIYRYIFYRVREEKRAEDLTERVFISAWEAIEGYQARGYPFSSWLYRIAHNLVANWHRDRSRRKLVSLDGLAAIERQQDDGPFQQVAQGERRDALLAAIRQLPADRQQLLILKYVERMPNAEIGRIMGRSEGAIKSLYHRTLLALRQDLDKPLG